MTTEISVMYGSEKVKESTRTDRVSSVNEKSSSRTPDRSIARIISIGVDVYTYTMILTCDENNTCNKISSISYRLLLKLHVLDAYTSPWLNFVKDTLNNIGLSGIWSSQSLPASRECFRQSIKRETERPVYPSMNNRNQ